MSREAAIFALAIVLVGCSSSTEQVRSLDAPTVAPTPSPSPSAAHDVSSRALEDGWTRLRSASEGITLDVPPKWRAIDLDPDALDATLRSLADQNPALGAFTAPTLRQLVTGGLRMFAVDPDPAHSDGRYVANANVLRQPVPSVVSLEAITAEAVTQIEATFKVKPVVDNVGIGGGIAARRIRYESHLQSQNGTIDISLQQIYALHGGAMWILTLAAPLATAPSYAIQFERVVGSFTPP